MNSKESMAMNLKIDMQLDKEVRKLCREMIKCWSLGHGKKDNPELFNLLYLYIKKSDLVLELHVARECALVQNRILKLGLKIKEENRKNNSC